MAKNREDFIKYAPGDWRSPVTRQALEKFNARIESLNDYYIRIMAQHVSSIGRLKATDITRLEQMRKLSMNINDVQQRIAKLANISDSELAKIFEDTCTFEGNDFLRSVVDSNNRLNWKDNYALRTAMQDQVAVTKGQLQNFSNTTVYSKPYQDAVDQAILAVQNGMTDYQSVINNAVKRCSEQGLRYVEYESGHHRRLDSAVRQNVLDGIRYLAQTRMDIIGQETDCDGVEISAHMLCAEDHLPYQGNQYYLDRSAATLNNGRTQVLVQVDETFEDIQNNLPRPFGQWNCKHWWTPILMNHTIPTYSKDELQAYDAYSREQITIENAKGEKITKSRYQWSQEQRRIETAVRRQKDIKTGAAAQNPANLDGVRAANTRIKKYKEAYEKLSEAAGLDSRYDLMGESSRKNVFRANIMLTSIVADGIIHTEGYFRQRSNTPNKGVFKVCKEPMNKQHLHKVIRQTGLYRKDVKYVIVDDPELLGRDLFGWTDPSGKLVEFYPDAFKNREQLVKTIGHEEKHIQQIEEFGDTKDSVECGKREIEAVEIEQPTWELYLERVNYNGE